ncbi:hypothetical protein TNIN_463701 [Trichonephila inaurata madagascariensis]|uniref:Uncharacterized protein n=1 Tax=Trichonephila inaurata madagascariensis TaxID=2747483 RepID=A0A8X6XPA8_9ARAC|nr:hypothetical protein TNIN_463701 [Trichonephila inaurata madagascariensis]
MTRCGKRKIMRVPTPASDPDAENRRRPAKVHGNFPTWDQFFDNIFFREKVQFSEKCGWISILTGPVISPHFPQSVDGKFMADNHVVGGDHVMLASQLGRTVSVTYQGLQS